MWRQKIQKTDLRAGNENSEKTKEGDGAFRILLYILLYGSLERKIQTRMFAFIYYLYFCFLLF